MKKSSQKRSETPTRMFGRQTPLKELAIKVMVWLCLAWVFIYVFLYGHSFKYTFGVLSTNNSIAMEHKETCYDASKMNYSPDCYVAYISVGDMDYYDTVSDTLLIRTTASFVWDWLNENRLLISLAISLFGLGLAIAFKYKKAYKFFFIAGLVTQVGLVILTFICFL